MGDNSTEDIMVSMFANAYKKISIDDEYYIYQTRLEPKSAV